MDLEAEEMVAGWAVEARANVIEVMVMVGAGMTVVAMAVVMVAGGEETAVAPEALIVGAAVRVMAVLFVEAIVVTGASEVEAERKPHSLVRALKRKEKSKTKASRATAGIATSERYT